MYANPPEKATIDGAPRRAVATGRPFRAAFCLAVRLTGRLRARVPGAQRPGGVAVRRASGLARVREVKYAGPFILPERKNPAPRALLGGGPWGRVQHEQMPIILDFGGSVQDYADAAHCAQILFPRPERCPSCGRLHVFIGHGYYPRKPKDQTTVYRIWLKRWFCKACHTTLSILPSFLLRFRHYLPAGHQAGSQRAADPGCGRLRVSSHLGLLFYPALRRQGAGRLARSVWRITAAII